MFKSLITYCALGLVVAHAATAYRFDIRADGASVALAPPQEPLLWNHTAEYIVRRSEEAIVQHRALLDRVSALAPHESNFSSVFAAIEAAETEFNAITSPLSFYNSVSPSKDLRDASNEVEKIIGRFDIEISLRVDVQNAKVVAEQNIRSSGEWENLTTEDRRLVEKMMLDGKREGLSLPEDKRKELASLNKELTDLSIEFDVSRGGVIVAGISSADLAITKKNYNGETGFISFTLEELKGVPADAIAGYPKRTEGTQELYDVSFKSTSLSPVTRFAEDPEVRRRAYEAAEKRLEVNVPITSKAIDVRRRVAAVHGYDSYAAYAIEIKLAKTPETVNKLLDDLQARLTPIARKEKDILLGIKLQHAEEKGLPFDNEIQQWDLPYYERIFIENTLNLDQNEVQEYFPVAHVVPSVLGIYQDLLNVRFEEVKGASTWHEDVQVFAVWEKDATDESGFLGYCYLDLFPRDNKYSHAAVWGILPGYERPDGKRSYPVALMVANLAKPTAERPALLKHSDVTTFFHEMGHVFHNLLSRTKYAKFHGTRVARDFVEAPSQMLENWCWEPKVLAIMSKHYTTGQPLSPELIEKIIKSQNVNVGISYLRQIFLSKFDMTVHTDKEASDYAALYRDLRQSITLIKTTSGAALGTFTHIMGGYVAGYYGYTYSLVFAADMYATVFKKDPLDPASGKLYRDKILRVGSSRDEAESLNDFLGRAPNSDAFLAQLFGAAEA